MLLFPWPALGGTPDVQSIPDHVVNWRQNTGFIGCFWGCLVLLFAWHAVDYTKEELIRCRFHHDAYNCSRRARKLERVILPKPLHRLKRLIACGLVQTDDAATLAKIEKIRSESPDDGEYIAPDGNGGFIAFVAGSKPDVKDSKHLHIEIISCDCYSEPQNPNCSLEQMQALLDQFNGQVIEADFSSVFWTPIKDLPSIGLILGCKVESELESMTIKQSSATFTVTRGPIDQIYWTRLAKRPDLLNTELSP